MEFVGFELAKKLEEKGFPQHWSDDDYVTENEEYECHFEVGTHYNRCFIPEHLPTIAAPTISQVLKWLRENHKLHISTKPYPCEDGLMWLYEIRNFSSVLVCVVANKTGFQEPELASLSGIDYVLDNLI
jgi:hypothetical protein